MTVHRRDAEVQTSYYDLYERAKAASYKHLTIFSASPHLCGNK